MKPESEVVSQILKNLKEFEQQRILVEPPYIADKKAEIVVKKPKRQKNLEKRSV